jgi:hypothetical protein
MQRDRRDYLSIRRTVGPEGWRLRRAHRVRGMIGLAVVVILTAMLHSPAGAQELPLGQQCWTLDPFVDTLRLSISQPPIPPTLDASLFALNGRWLAFATAGQQAAGGAGPASYQLLGAGTSSTSIMLPNSIELGFLAVHNTTFFGGNAGCNFFAVIDNLSFNGNWNVECPGPTPFAAQGTLTFVSPCPDQF